MLHLILAIYTDEIMKRWPDRQDDTVRYRYLSVDLRSDFVNNYDNKINAAIKLFIYIYIYQFLNNGIYR